MKKLLIKILTQKMCVLEDKGYYGEVTKKECAIHARLSELREVLIGKDYHKYIDFINKVVSDYLESKGIA